MSAVVAEIVRSGVVEGHHHGSVVALGADGEVAYAAGDVDSAMLPRSCNKPVQALAMVRHGLDLPPDLLALASGSHSGERFHVEGVRRILAGTFADQAAADAILEESGLDWTLVRATRLTGATPKRPPRLTAGPIDRGPYSVGRDAFAAALLDLASTSDHAGEILNLSS